MNPRLADPSVLVVARSPELQPESVTIAVTVPTFRRPAMLLDTLASLRAQRTARRFATIVIENEAEAREGANAAAPLFESGKMAGLVIVAQERGNCSAYNAGWATALMQFPALTHVAVIDDDERAEPEWLERLAATAQAHGAAIVGGPQVPLFDDPAHRRFAEHPVFAPPYRTTGTVPALYSSGNLLVGRPVLERLGAPFLDTRFNFTGGGDSDFLSRAAAAGFTLAWCAEARTAEIVPPRRVEADWLRARSLRNGAISTLVEQGRRRNEPLGGARTFAHSAALLAAAPLRALARLARGATVAQAAYPVWVGLGRVGAHFGYANEQYRQPDKN